jgi:hypothetical protein
MCHDIDPAKRHGDAVMVDGFSLENDDGRNTHALGVAGFVAAPVPNVRDPLLWRWEHVQGQII